MKEFYGVLLKNTRVEYYILVFEEYKKALKIEHDIRFLDTVVDVKDYETKFTILRDSAIFKLLDIDKDIIDTENKECIIEDFRIHLINVYPILVAF